MNDQTEDRFSMYLKVNAFLSNFNSMLASYPAIIALHNELRALIGEITTHEGNATVNSKGYKEQKSDSRTTLIASTVKVSSALFAYWLNASAVNGLKPADYKVRELTRKPDGNLYLRASKLHELADPVKALLGPYNCTAADVDSLSLKNKKFFDDVEAPKKARQEKADARKMVIKLMRQGTVILKKLDIYLATFNSTNKNMFLQYKLARKVDKSGGKKKKKGNKKPKPDAQASLFVDI